MKMTLSVLALLALTAPAIAQAVPVDPRATPVEGCRIWEAHIASMIERHRRAGTSEAVLEEALNRAYAAYAQCVMGGCDMSESTVAVLEILSRDRKVALADGSMNVERGKACRRTN